MTSKGNVTLLTTAVIKRSWPNYLICHVNKNLQWLKVAFSNCCCLEPTRMKVDGRTASWLRREQKKKKVTFFVKWSRENYCAATLNSNFQPLFLTKWAFENAHTFIYHLQLKLIPFIPWFLWKLLEIEALPFSVYIYFFNLSPKLAQQRFIKSTPNGSENYLHPTRWRSIKQTRIWQLNMQRSGGVKGW